MNKCYYKVYPNSKEGDTSVSVGYDHFILSISSMIVSSDMAYGGVGWTPDHHIKFMVGTFQEIGINVIDPDPTTFFIIEEHVLNFLDAVNANVLDNEVSLGSLPRSYSRFSH